MLCVVYRLPVLLFQKLFIEDSKFHRFVLDPTLQKKLKKDTIMAITKKLNLSDVSTNFYGKICFPKFIVRVYFSIIRC